MECIERLKLKAHQFGNERLCTPGKGQCGNTFHAGLLDIEYWLKFLYNFLGHSISDYFANYGLSLRTGKKSIYLLLKVFYIQTVKVKIYNGGGFYTDLARNPIDDKLILTHGFTGTVEVEKSSIFIASVV